jgi:hypothetical protein
MVPAFGIDITVTSLVAVAEPQKLVTVKLMVIVPGEMPVTIPVVLTLAISALDEDHTPTAPDLVSSVALAPTHITDAPLKVPATGIGLTETKVLALHPIL